MSFETVYIVLKHERCLLPEKKVMFHVSNVAYGYLVTG
jgi:hypothetical protein